MSSSNLSSLFFILCFTFSIPTFAQDANPKIKTQKRPNIIFILTDDHRWDATGYSGNKLAYTPEMDKLAHSGTVFNNAFATTPICSASRATIVSGLYERTHRYTFESEDIKEDFMKNCFPNVLKKSGYQTAFFGKFGVKYKGISNLYDQYENYDREAAYPDRRGYYYKKIGQETVHLTRYTGQKGIDYIKNVSADTPFCLQLSFSAPHAHDNAKEQYFWDAETDFVLENTTIPNPIMGDKSYFNQLPKSVQDGFNRVRWTWRFDSPEKYQQMVKGYYRMIAGVDMEITKIRKQLEEKGIADNTIIILLADNGYFLGERQIADKWLMYDTSIRVPLVIYDPRVKEHKEISEMALNVDIAPTIIDFAGAKSPVSWHGKSLVSLVQSKSASIQRDTVLIEHLWEFKNIPPSEGVRTKDWKYFRYVNDKSLEELYNLSKDPFEKNNLAKNKKHQTVLLNLRSKCDALIDQRKDSKEKPAYGLTVDFFRKPEEVVLKDNKPVFSWIVPSQAISQSSYQILVASTIESLNNNVGDVWNSQQVKDKVSANIIFRGNELKSNLKYFWKVRIWDALNRTGEYSSAQMFQIAEKEQNTNIQNQLQKSIIKPQVLTKNGNVYFVDFGKHAFGTVELTYESKADSKLIIRLGEQLENGAINRKPTGTIRYQEVNLDVKKGKFTYLIQLVPDKRNTGSAAVILPASIPVIMPFRYCEIENATEKLTEKDINQIVYHTLFEENQSSFTSSNDNLNKVWDLCKYSIKATLFTGLYVDGDRERIPYEADAYINQLSHYGVDREYTVAQNTIEYFMQHPTWPTEWQQHMALLFYEDYKYTGSTKLIAKHYEALKHKTLMELAREDGLISSTNVSPEFMKKLGFADPEAKLKDIVDWPPAQKNTAGKLSTGQGERDGYVFMPFNTVVNCFFYKNMEIMAEFARVLNRVEDESVFLDLARKSKKAINTKLFDAQKGVYTDGEGTSHASLHANMMALAFNIVPKAHQKTVVDFIKSRGMACSVYGSQYLLQGLFNAGQADYAIELMTATHDRSWINMLKLGSTVTLEAWDMKYKPNLDWNHAWGAAPANIIPRNMWGIQPQIPGGSIISIKPQMGKLDSSAIEVPLLKGIVKASYVKKGKLKQIFSFEIPANVAANLYLDYTSNDVILLNGQKVDLSFDSIRLSSGVNTVEMTVNTF